MSGVHGTCALEADYDELADCATIVHSSQIPWTLSNSFAKTCGLLAGISRLITFGRIIAYGKSACMWSRGTYALHMSRACTSCRTTLSSQYNGYRAGKGDQMLSRKLELYALHRIFPRNRLTCGAQYVAMSAGIIKGALARLGFQAVVVPEITTLPQCTPLVHHQLARSLIVRRYIPSQAAQRIMKLH